MRNPRNDTLGSPKTEADASPAKGSERRCVLTGQTSARDDLVRLAISPDGDVLPDALAKASEMELDLVMISDKSTPPVCKIVDFGKLRYQLERKKKENAKKTKSNDIKEVKMKKI